MTWDYGKTVNTVVGGLVTIKVMETGMKMIERASNTNRKTTAKTNKSKFHSFGASFY